jgi:hypothetical protein
MGAGLTSLLIVCDISKEVEAYDRASFSLLSIILDVFVVLSCEIDLLSLCTLFDVVESHYLMPKSCSPLDHVDHELLMQRAMQTRPIKMKRASTPLHARRNAPSKPPHPFLSPLIFTAAPPSPWAVPPLNLPSFSSLPLQIPTCGMNLIGSDVAS